MAELVLDASVTLKWFLAEEDSALALRVLGEGVDGRQRFLQPPHWQAEVAAVLARLAPASARRHLVNLSQLACIEIVDSPRLLLDAVQLATRLDHHVFDTLYHALALERGCDCLTADRRYWRKARALGSLRLLDSAGSLL